MVLLPTGGSSFCCETTRLEGPMSSEQGRQEHMAVLEFVYAHGPLSVADLRRGIGSPLMPIVSGMIRFSGFLIIEGPRDPEGGYEDEALIRLSPAGVEEVLNAPPATRPTPSGPEAASKKVVKKPKRARVQQELSALRIAESRNRHGRTPRWRP